jgi:hypothetical protein
MDSVDAAHYSSAGASAQQSSYQPPPISNYKGVMLCDRPVNKATGSKVPQATASGQQMPFNCRFVQNLNTRSFHSAHAALQHWPAIKA